MLLSSLPVRDRCSSPTVGLEGWFEYRSKYSQAPQTQKIAFDLFHDLFLFASALDLF